MIRACIRPLLSPQPRARLSLVPVRMMESSSPKPKIAKLKGQDESQVLADLDQLVQNGWKLNVEKAQIEKKYHFSRYAQVLEFHSSIGAASDEKNHHSVMTSEYCSLHVVWTTHRPAGLSRKDVALAQICDTYASKIGTVDVENTPRC